MQGKKVTRLNAGTAYRFVIRDRSSIHDFHLSGPGFNRVLTGVEFTGTKSFLLRLKKGSYRFVCDPHSGSMGGGFLVSRTATTEGGRRSRPPAIVVRSRF
jgi:plastocyanin